MSEKHKKQGGERIMWKQISKRKAESLAWEAFSNNKPLKMRVVMEGWDSDTTVKMTFRENGKHTESGYGGNNNSLGEDTLSEILGMYPISEAFVFVSGSSVKSKVSKSSKRATTGKQSIVGGRMIGLRV